MNRLGNPNSSSSDAILSHCSVRGASVGQDFIFLAAVLVSSTTTNLLNWYWWASIEGAAGLVLLFWVLAVHGGFLLCCRDRRSTPAERYCGRSYPRSPASICGSIQFS